MQPNAPATIVRILGFLMLLAPAPAMAEGFPKFRHQTIDPNCGDVCYAVSLADVDGDGRKDIVAATESRVLWYQAPDWKKRVIIENQTERDNVCIAPLDIDGDGKIDFALGAGWTKVGTIQWLSRNESLDDKWNVHLIGEERWLHRMRFANVLGNKRPQLVISPLNKTVGAGVRLTALQIPAHPKTDRWPRTVLDASLNRMHNHWHFKPKGSSSIKTLTASQEGIHLISKTDTGWQKTRYSAGMPGKTASQMGAGEIKSTRLPSGRMLIATIEPMHGTSLVVYLQSKKDPAKFERRVLDDSFRRGHALWLADVDGDNMDEIIVGHSDTGAGENRKRGVYVFDAQDATGTKWVKHVIDEGGVAVEDAVAGDLTGDGRIDIVAGGRYTHNIKLYVNLGSE
jgi:hypothetical protein